MTKSRSSLLVLAGAAAFALLAAPTHTAAAETITFSFEGIKQNYTARSSAPSRPNYNPYVTVDAAEDLPAPPQAHKVQPGPPETNAAPKAPQTKFLTTPLWGVSSPRAPGGHVKVFDGGTIPPSPSAKPNSLKAK